MFTGSDVTGADVTGSDLRTNEATSSDGSRAAQSNVEDLRRRNTELEARVTELSQALRQVEAASRLAAVAAHDIRNALTVILGEADLLVSSLEDPEQLESAKAVTSAGQIVAAIAQDMLGAARKTQRRVPEVNTAELMVTTQPLMLRVLKPPIEVVFASDDDLWPVTVQEQQLEAALLNLAANARDALPEGGRVRVTARNVPQDAELPLEVPPGCYVGLAVEDTGTGMEPAVLAKATEAFFTTKGRDRGTGLGLAMVKALAMEAGGTLQIESEPGRGTRVEILLPRAPVRVKSLDLGDSRCVLTRKLAARVRAPWLRDALQAWRDACGSRALPPPASVEAALIDHAESVLVLGVSSAVKPAELRLLRMGAELVNALRRSALTELSLNGPELFGNLEASYRAAMRSRRPSYQFARYSFGQGAPAELERLIFPAALDGETVSHLIGVVLMSGVVKEGSHEQ